MRLLGNIFMLASAAALFSYPFIFHVTSGGLWRFSVAGRALMAFMGMLGAVMVLAVTNLLFDLPSWFRPLIWIGIACASWWQVRTLFVVRSRGKGI